MYLGVLLLAIKESYFLFHGNDANLSSIFVDLCLATMMRLLLTSIVRDFLSITQQQTQYSPLPMPCKSVQIYRS